MPYKTGGHWMAQVKKNGKKKRKRFRTKSEAIEWEVIQKQTKQVQVTKEQSETHTISLIEWTTQYLDFAEIKFSTKTYKEKRVAFKLFFQSVDHALDVTELNAGMVLRHLQKQATQRSGFAANKDRKNLVAAWNWGIKYLELPSLNPCLVDRFPEVRHERYVPPEKDFWSVYDVAENDQDRVMLLAYLHLAARRSELFQLRWRDVDFAGLKVRLFTRKRKDGSLEHDWLPMTDDLYEALLQLRQTAENEWVFPNATTGRAFTDRNKWVPRLCESAGVKRFNLHGIRHLTASILAQADVPMVMIQQILRHKKLSTTERYIGRPEILRSKLEILSIKGPRAHKKAHSEIKKGLALVG